jgi:peptidoglycan/LPS O-acetylase OafA/YrhL
LENCGLEKGLLWRRGTRILPLLVVVLLAASSGIALVLLYAEVDNCW